MVREQAEKGLARLACPLPTPDDELRKLSLCKRPFAPVGGGGAVLCLNYFCVVCFRAIFLNKLNIV